MDSGLSNTVDNGFTNQELSRLLDISKSMNEAKTPLELLAGIREKVMQLIPFYDTGFLIVEKDGLHHYDLSVNLHGWDKSEGNLKLIEKGLTKIRHPKSYIEHVMRLLESSDTPIIEDYERRVKEFDYPFFFAIEEIGYKEGLVTALKSGGKTFGTFWLNSLKKNHFKKDQFQLFEAIADQVSITVTNMLANEELQNENRKQAILLEISEHIATTNHKKQLFSGIIDQVNEIIPVDDTAIIVLSKDGSAWQNWKNIDNYQESVSAKNLNQAGLVDDLALNDFMVLSFNTTGILAIEEYIKEKHPFAEKMHEAGLREFMFTPLISQGITIGSLFFASEKYHTYSRKYFDSFKAIANMVASAVANSTANEDITRREGEKDILLSISQKLSGAAKADELLNLIINELKPIFNFYDAGILVIDENAIGVHDLSVVHPHIDNSDKNRFLSKKGHYKQNQLLKLENSVVQYVLDQLNRQKTPLIFDYTQDFSGYSDAALLNDKKNRGYISAWILPLIQQGKTLGILTLNFCKDQVIPTEKKDLFVAVADRIGLSLGNVLVNEEVLQREKEKALLYKIASAIANVKERNSLMKLILNEIKDIFQFYDVGLAIIDSNGSTATDWSTLTPEISPSDNNYEINANQLYKLPFKDSLFERLVYQVQSEGHPLIIKFDERLVEENPDLKDLLELEIRNGYKECLFTYLKAGNEILGSFNINSLDDNFFSQKDFHLFQAVADLVAVAVANILANEEITRREAEKSGLLKISEAISKIQSKGQLLNVIYQNVGPVFPFDSAGLFVIDNEKNFMYEILDAEAFPDDLQKSLAASNNLGPWIVTDSNPNSWWMLDETVVRTMELEAELATNKVGYDQFKEGLKYGLKHFIGGPMYANGKKIGALCFNSKQSDFYGDEHLSMFKSISEQISVAVANILATEEIARQQKEKTLLLYLSTELSLTKSISDITQLIFDRIKNLIDADGVVLALLSRDKKSYKAVEHQSSPEILASYKADPLYARNFSQYVPIAVDQFIFGDDVFSRISPYYADVADVLARYPDHGWANLMQKAGAKSTTAYVLRLNDEPLGALFWHWREELARPEEFFPLIQGIGDLTAITISNLLSVAELQDRAKQIEVLNQKLEEQNAYLEEEIFGKYNFGEIIGESPALKNTYHNIKLVSKSDTTVLITGESGTGKELVARAIHEASDRRDKTLIKLNCAALPAQLVESELFGHEKGAFTGATDRRIGKFELAHESTIFLDEVGELPLDLQAKLLRVLQEKELERLGGNKVIKTNVRVLSATNRDLQKEVHAGRFRSDLFYRLNVFPIHLPPLKDRKEDIPPLVQHFLKKYQKKLGKQINSVSNKVMNELINYSWPGNIRELEHVLERSCILCSDKVMKQVHLPKIENDSSRQDDLTSIGTLADNERNHIVKALKKCNGKVSGTGGAAELLNMKPTTLEFRMKKLGIKREFR